MVLNCGAGEDQLDRSCAKMKKYHRVKEKRDVLRTTKRRKANWIGHILGRNCLTEHVIEGKRKVTGRRGRSMQLLEDLKETSQYWKVKEEAL
jgi:hypothetical protein